MIESAPLIAELLKLGWPGIFIAYLIWRLHRAEALIDQLLDRDGKVQERRAEEREKNAAALASAAQSQDKLAEASQHQSSAIGALIGEVKVLIALFRDARHGGS